MQKDMRDNHKTIIKTILRHLLGMRLYETVMMTWHLGYIPHIKHPRSFNEKIANRKIYHWRKIPSNLADKYAVREVVAKTIGEQYLNELLGVYDTVDEIDFAKLPESFVIKATHGSNMNIIIRNRQAFDEGDIHEKCRMMLENNFGFLSNELWYTQIKPRLIVENFMHDKKYVIPRDYKFFVFHGRVELVQVNSNKTTELCLSFYDREWNRQNLVLKDYKSGPNIVQPSQYQKMVQLSEKLSKNIDFVRVDLYVVSGEGIIFGELTFAPNAGIKAFVSDRQHDFQLGTLW
jgi:hypothetical protein